MTEYYECSLTYALVHLIGAVKTNDQIRVRAIPNGFFVMLWFYKAYNKIIINYLLASNVKSLRENLTGLPY